MSTDSADEYDKIFEEDRRRIREQQAERARAEAEERAERQRKAQEALEMLNAQAEKAEEKVAKVEAAPKGAKKESAKKAERPSLPTVHVVQPGDTLSAIAQKYYGNAALWTEIFKKNKHIIGDDPGKIFPGQELQIPALD